MLRTLSILFAMLMLMAPAALAQNSAPAAPAGGSTVLETTAPGDKTTVQIEVSSKITEPTNVFVGGREVPLNQWEWEFVGGSKEKFRIQFDAPPSAGEKVEVRVDYPKTKPILQDATWS